MFYKWELLSQRFSEQPDGKRHRDFMTRAAPAIFVLRAIIVWLVYTRIFAGRDQRA